MNRIIYRFAYVVVFMGILFTMGCGTRSAFTSIPIPPVPSNPEDYIEVQDKVSTKPRYVNGGELRFTYRENYENDNLDYKIYNQRREVVQSAAGRPVTIAYGLNKIAMPLEPCPHTASGQHYSGVARGLFVLEITDGKGRKKYLTFLKTYPGRAIPCEMEAATGRLEPSPATTL